jgi:flagellar L-ring protein precursor FlgH
MKLNSSWLLVTSALLTLSACAGQVDRFERMGSRPPMSAVENPQSRPGYQPLSWPMPDPEPASTRTANSLWQPGSRGFFRDQRAARVGDILRVNIAIADQAKFDNTVNRARTSAETAAAPTLLGHEGTLERLTAMTPAALLNATGNSNTNSTGKIDRKETINTQVAAAVTQVLPNGNLVIEGSQEILVNYEVREIGVKGVIRPEDIRSDNTIESTQVAQARITYGGRGHLDDFAKPRWGQELVDILSPF